jgi:hypothetical protein
MGIGTRLMISDFRYTSSCKHGATVAEIATYTPTSPSVLCKFSSPTYYLLPPLDVATILNQ